MVLISLFYSKIFLNLWYIDKLLNTKICFKKDIILQKKNIDNIGSISYFYSAIFTWISNWLMLGIWD